MQLPRARGKFSTSTVTLRNFQRARNCDNSKYPHREVINEDIKKGARKREQIMKG